MADNKKSRAGTAIPDAANRKQLTYSISTWTEDVKWNM